MESFANTPVNTSTAGFTHLKVHSSYSLGIGLNTPAEICAHAARLGFSSVAITDTGGTYGFIEFHIAAKKYGIKPIYGAVVRHRSSIRSGDEHFALTLLAVSQQGLAQLAALASLCAAEERGAALDMDSISRQAAGIVAFAGSGESEISRLLRDGDVDSAIRCIDRFKSIFGDRLFVEVQDHGRKEERAHSDELLALAGRTRTAPLLTQEVKYLERRMRDWYETLRGVRHPAEERDFFPMDTNPADWSLKTPLEMSQLKPFYEAAYENALRIDEMVPGDLLDGLDAGGVRETPEHDAMRDEINGRCVGSLEKRYARRSGPEIDRYRSILSREVALAVSEGLGPGLLLFQRVVSRLRECHVDLGPATGLGFQSLCAYLLGITAFDPYHFDRGFQPNFDTRSRDTREFELQLTAETRLEASHALFSLLDRGKVAYLPAIERITPAKAVRMAASVVNVASAELDEVQEIIGRHPGVPIERLNELDRSLGTLYRRSLAVRDLLSRASLLEDLPVGIVRSRRSLAVSPVPLTNYLGCSIDSESGDLFIQCGRENFPLYGVFRVDVTSLGALSVAVRAEAALLETGVADYGWERFSIDEKDVWRQIQGGDTTGIFLFEGQATLQQRESFRLESIDDLTNFLALMRLRDGGETLSDRFAAFGKESLEAAADGEAISEILRTTRGHILYHEQIRDIVSVLTGATAHEAWQRVRDLRSSSPGRLSAVRSQFMIGCAEKGVSVETATRWFERLLRNAKTATSHKRVFADALLVYKLFFLKTRHEAWFYAALLNSNLENEGKLSKYAAIVRERGLLLGLDANRSGFSFKVEDGGIRMGFCTVKGVDEERSHRIVKARARKPFGSFDEFVRRVGTKHFERAEVKSLIDAGAFDSLGIDRVELSKRLAVLFGRRSTPSKANGQGQLELPFDS